MIMLLAIAASTALIASYVAHRVRAQKQREERRLARRRRNRAYQRAWDAIMMRPRTRQLTDQRERD
jgi:siroheme synthase (precorrin-2 oxidase/ferrochelatase)